MKFHTAIFQQRNDVAYNAIVITFKHFNQLIIILGRSEDDLWERN